MRRSFQTAAEFDSAWRASEVGAFPSRVDEIATLIGRGLSRDGFRLFHNGGLPQLDRRHDELRAEVLFPTRPHSGEFAVRFHLTHEGVGAVRAKFWRPSIRAPKTIAAGDICLLEPEPVYALWSSEDTTETAAAILRLVEDRLLPWFDLIDDPARLRASLEEGVVPMIDLTTAVEIMLAEFGAREARRFIRNVAELAWPPLVVPKPEGFELNETRMASVVAYYQL